jgi:N-carbamoyl-L-amino-acid hydrolase
LNEEWIANEIDKIARFSESTQGITRSTLSDEATKARQYIAALMTQAGLLVRYDQVGNIIGRMETKENRERAAVMAGSHLDTQPNSSKYHGILGILSAIAAVYQLKSKGSLSHPIEIIAFTGEAAGRFGISLLGSTVAAGKLSPRILDTAKDQYGLSLLEALAKQGFDLKVGAKPFTAATCKAFLELYIDQGQVLEKQGAQIGIAQNVAGTTKCRITVNGCAAHDGWTPMDERQDALVSAAMIILAVQEIAQESEKRVLATVSDLKVSPGKRHVVPGMVEMWVDISSSQQEGIIQTLQEIKDAISVIAENQETTVSIEILSAEKPIKLSPVVVAALKEACQANKFSHCYINCGSRHDAANVSSITPSGMLFIPYHTKNKEDYVALLDIQAGLKVLTQVLFQLAQ